MSFPLNSLIHNNGGDGDHISRAITSSTPPLLGHYYEVFLSFRGETRRGFTDHLYKRLDKAGISVFRDKEGLPMGERNWPELLKAIEASTISIPIISPDYASSEWCLNELVHILKCKKTFGQHVMPIFYHIRPSDVRKQLDVSKEESQVCKKRRDDFDDMHVQEWKDALMEVSYMTGLESKKVANGYEGELVEIIVAKVQKALKKHTLVVSDDLVGVEDHVEKFMNMVNVEGSNDVRAILIHGMGGIGKTTLAKVLYNQLAHQFDCCSFLANIRETWAQHKGKVDLQEQLILHILGQKQSISSIDEGVEIIRDRFKYKKVLILLDDVDHGDQLNALAGKRDWFGRGSMLIITSRINNVLKKWEGSFSYELNGLNDDHSFQLFCKHGFKRCYSIPNEFHTIAKEIVFTTGGLPLAIEVIGCLLYGEDQHIWEEKLKKLKEIPDDEVQSKLKISFDTLKHEEQEIFLDIACLSIHKEKELAFHMWDSCGFYPELGIKKLISMSLIKIRERKELFIHDQLRDLGREIVRQESMNNLGKCSRLWKTKEAREVLQLKQGTEKIQTLNLLPGFSPVHRNRFVGMTELRYLRMGWVRLRGDFENLFQNLRWLKWNYGEFDFMSNFIPKKVVVLELSFVNITELWMGWSQIKHLKVLKLKNCLDLTTIPDFLALKELEVLILKWCCNMRKIDPSIGKLSKTLKVLDVSCCGELTELPIEVGEMEELRELLLDNTSIREIPISEGYMTKLEKLSAQYCHKLECIPDSIGSLMKLQRLLLYGCKLLTKIPESIGKLKLLTKLDLRSTGITKLPNSIGDLYNLKLLYLSWTPIKCLPSSIQMLSKLQVLDLLDCYELESLPYLPTSLTSLAFYGNLMETLPDFSNLTNLERLLFTDDFRRWNRVLKFGNLKSMESLLCEHSVVKFGVLDFDMHHAWELFSHYSIEGFEIVQSEESKSINLLLELPLCLVELRLKYCYTLRTLPNLKNLSLLYIENCPELMKIDGLDEAKSLTHLEIGRCRKLAKLNGMGISVMNLILEDLDALESLPDLSTAKKLKELMIISCRNLVEIKGLNNVEGVQNVLITGCSSLERIGDLSHLKMLTTLKLCYCKKLSEIRGLENLTLLKALDISGCTALRDLLNLPKMLTTLELCNCKKLSDIQGLENLTSLKVLDISGCTALQGLPDLPNVRIRSYTLEEVEERESDSDHLEEE